MLVKYPIIVKNLTYKVGFKKILQNISLALEKNEYVGVIGGSGSGKTSLLTCINGYRDSFDGEVILNGVTSRKKNKTRHLIGYVPQEDIVHRTLTIERALHYAYLLRLDDTIPDDKIDVHVDEILHQLDLREQKFRKIRSLSGGQRKRVNIGIELLHSPALFFLDEPTAGLDPGLEKQLMRLLASLADENRLIMVTTHVMLNVDIFDILIYIHKGNMIYFGPSGEITKFFRVGDMVELFEKVTPLDPVRLKNHYMKSSLFRNFLAPRLRTGSHVQ